MLEGIDQLVLDSICDRVARRVAPGLVGWSIGKRQVAATMVARALKESKDDVDQAISRLIERGLLRDTFVTDDEWEQPIVDEIGLRHQAWLESSRFNEKVVTARWGFETLDEWLEWDGIDGSPMGGFEPGPFHVPLPVEVVRLPSKDYEVFWKNKVIWAEAYNDMPEIPRTIQRLAIESRSVEEFTCRLISFLATLPWFDLDFVSSIVEATKEGWVESDSMWAEVLRAYLKAVEEKQPESERSLVFTIKHI